MYNFIVTKDIYKMSFWYKYAKEKEQNLKGSTQNSHLWILMCSIKFLENITK